MVSDTVTRKRMLKQVEHVIRKVNLEIINPMIPPLDNELIMPVMAVVARTRGAYLKELLDTAQASENGLPSEEQIKRMRHSREAYEEMLAASQALETVIERGYLDVKL